MQLDGHGGNVIVLLEAGIFSAGWVFLLQPTNMIANRLEPAMR